MGRNFTPEVLQALDAPFRNGLAPRQGLVFDGTATCSLSNVAALGATDFTLSAWVRTNAVGAIQMIFGRSASIIYGSIIYITAAGKIEVSNIGAGVMTGNATVAANKWYHVTYVRATGIGYLYVNAVQDQTAADATTYSQSQNTIGSFNGTYFFNGTIALPVIYNRALSAAEVATLYESNAPAASDYNAASNTAINTSNWTDGGSAVLTGVSATGFTEVHAAGTAYVKIGPLPSPALNIGQRIKITGVLARNNGKTVFPALAVHGSTATTLAADGAFSVELPVTAAMGVYGVIISATGDSDYTMSSLVVTRLGLLCAPESNAPGNGLVWNDQSGNGAHIVLPTTGVAWSLPSNASNRIRATSSTLGNQQLLAASALVASGFNILRARARSRSGTPTVKLGYSSGAGEIVAAVALSTAWSSLTLLVTVTAAASGQIPLWANSTTSDVVEWDISVEPLSV